MNLGTNMLTPTPPPPCKLKNIFFFPMFLQRPVQLKFYTYLPKQKRYTKSSYNPFNANISFEAYLHIPVSKVEEGNYESYNLQGVYLMYTVFLLLQG